MKVIGIMYRWRSLLLLMLAGLAGCTAAGAVLHAAFGPPDVDAKYVPPKVSTLIMVENFRNPSANQIDADQIAREVGDELKSHNAVPIVDQDKLVELRDQNQASFHTLTIPDVGKAVGAKTVIYIDLFDSGIVQDSGQSASHATATARVRVVDVKTGSTLWPVDAEEGYELSVTMPYGHEDEVSLRTSHAKALSSLSDSIAKLFYAWKPDTEEESNGGSPSGLGLSD